MPEIMKNAPRLHLGPEAKNLGPYSLEQLQTERDYAETRLSSAKADIAAIDAEYTRRFMPLVKKRLEDNEALSATLEGPGGFKIKGSISKTVKWDSPALQAVASTMSWAQASHFFKIAFSMAEATYKALDPESELARSAATARTTKYGELKITVEAPKS